MQSHRQRHATARGHVAHLRALAADPHVYRLAAEVTRGNVRDHRVGGRPAVFPDWALVIFGAAVRVFGSASAVERALADPPTWGTILIEAGSVLGSAAVIGLPSRGPTRDHFHYFKTRRITADVLASLLDAQRDLAAARAVEVGLADPDDARPVTAYRRDHVVAIDGKVFSSPQRTQLTERVNKQTGEVRPVRQDPARSLHAESGRDSMVWGSKYAIASIRSPLANHRVILGIAHIPAGTPGGEGQVFADLACDITKRNPGVHAFVADGAWRGKHIRQVQAGTGRAVIAPPRHKDAKHGGIPVGKTAFAAQRLPRTTRRDAREAPCGGHDLWAAAGTLFERVITVDGTPHLAEVTRGQTKRDTTTNRDGTTSYQYYGHYRLTCAAAGDHNWWEPLNPVVADASSRFHRAEYLRLLPCTTGEHRRIYSMRADTESLNATLERAFYGQRLPAWGSHNQTVTVLLAAIAENAWARHVWHQHLDQDGDLAASTSPPRKQRATA